MSIVRTRAASQGTAGARGRAGARGLALSRPRLSATALPWLVTALGAAVGGTWHLVMSLRRAEGLTSGAFDYAYFQQLVWNLAHGGGFRSSFNPGEFLGLHFSPLLLVPAALHPLWPDARLLMLLQALAITLAPITAFLFLRALLRPAAERAWLAAALAAPIPFWAVIQQQTRAGFHTEVLALPLVLLAGWAGLTGRTAILWLAAVLALGAKEDQVFPVAVIGLVIAARAGGRLRSGMRRHGLGVVTLAVAWAAVVFGLVMPALRGGVAYDVDRYYAWLGGGLGLLRAPFEQTPAFIAALTRPEGWLVTGGLVLSLALLPLLRLRWAFLLLPPTIANLLSRHEPQPQQLLQYGMLLVVPALVAGGLGARRLVAFARRRVRRREAARHAAGLRAGSTESVGTARPAVRRPVGRLAWRAAAPLLVLAVPAFAIGLTRGSVPPFSSREEAAYARPAALERLRAAAAQVPADAPVSVDWGAAAAFANRPRLELFPTASADVFVIVDREPYTTGLLRWRDRRAWLEALERSGRRLLVDDGRFQVWSPVGD